MFNKDGISDMPKKKEHPLVARIMRLTDNDAMDLCQSFNVSPKGTKFLTAKAVVDRVTGYGIPDAVDLLTRQLEKAEKRTPKPKRVKIEYETDFLSSPETLQRIIEEQSKLSGCPVFNVKVTEVK